LRSATSGALGPTLRALFASFTIVALAASPAAAANGGLNGKIAFDRSSPYFPVNQEIDTINPDGTGETTVSSTSPSLYPAWSPSGTRIAFAQGTRLMTMNADGSNAQTVLNWTDQVGAIDWSPNEQQLAVALLTCDSDGECRFDIYTLNLDGTALTDITPDVADDRNPSWSAGTLRIAFDSTRGGDPDIYSVAPDGSDARRLTTSPGSDLDPDWSPDGEQLVWTNGQTISRMNADGTNPTGVTAGDAPAWAPDQSLIVFARSDPQCVGREAIWTARYDGVNAARISNPFQSQCTNSSSDSDPDWQPLPGSYVRPKGATPLRIPLVPAYKPCTSPNTTHGAPLAFPACAPPLQASGRLTVGTSEANGAPSASVGSVLLKMQPSIQNVGVGVSLSDVREQGTLADYQGELELAFTARLTDKRSGPMGNEAATVSDFDVIGSIPCYATPDSPVGSNCLVSTTLGALFGSFGPITGARQIWEIDRVTVYDGGADGNGATQADNTLFMDQGVFVP
jgi:hypothetical protein